MSFRITEMLAYVTIGEDDEEAIPAFLSGGVWHPMIMADRTRFKDLLPMAQRMRDGGMELKLVRFTAREEVDEKELLD